MAMTARSWLAAALLLAALPTSVRAQLASPLSVRLTPVEPTPPARIRSLGDLSSCHAWTCDQALSLGLEVAPVPSWRMATEVTGARTLLPGGDGRVSDRRVDVIYGSARRSAWLGYGRSTEDAAGSSTQLSRLEYGATARWRSLSVDATMGSGSAPTLAGLGSHVETSLRTTLDSLTGATRVDTIHRTVTDTTAPGRTRWSSTALRVAWTTDRWSVGALLGRLIVIGMDRPLWGSLDGSHALGRNFTVLAKAGTVVGPFMSTRGGPRVAVSAGLFAHTSWLSTAPIEPPADRGAAPFDVSRVDGERYRLTIRMRGATQVEIASDVTAWQPVPMRKLRDDVWIVELAVATGIHQLSVRADGGAWVAPAGLTPVDDDYGGSSGAFVVR